VVPVKLAILGTRGVPANYGGFETFAAELSTRLVGRGHDVSVYCREPGDATWNGVHRIVLPAAQHKYLETVSHAFLSALDALRRDFDAVLVCNAANAFVLPLLRAARIPVAINVDGIERRRRKWNVLGRAVYTIGEAFSVSFANSVIADAGVIADYYREQWAASPVTIPYGADFPVEEDSDVLSRLGLTAGHYILYVSRFEPENNPLEVVEAYERTMNTEHGTRNDGGEDRSVFRVPRSVFPPLVMLGKGLYAPELVAELHRHAGDKILFPGALYGRDYRTLQRNALLYIQATEVGGTHPALIEAMASNGVVLAHDTPENREVGGDAVGYFHLRPAETLSGTVLEWLSDPLKREDFRVRARNRAEQRYSWERVTDQYERLFKSL
jgi:glycosyltransferase involved in cell wall biosynthesis